MFMLYKVTATMNLWIVSATYYSIHVQKKLEDRTPKYTKIIPTCWNILQIFCHERVFLAKITDNWFIQNLLGTQYEARCV